MATQTAPNEIVNGHEPASDRLLWALRSATKIDYRGKGLTKAQATLMLEAANAAKGYTGKAKPTETPVKAAQRNVPPALGTSPLVATTKPLKAKKKAKKKVKKAVGPFVVTKEFRKEAEAFMLKPIHVQALYKTLFGATSIVEGLVNDVTGKDTGLVLVGGGCGFGIVDGYRKTEKNKAIKELGWSFKEALNEKVRALMPPALIAKLQAVGNPVRALQMQCELYNATFASIVAGYMESLGIKGVYSTSRAD